MSWPAACAYGPSWPQPVMRPYTSFGLRARHASGPIPSRSATPGRKPSMSASACSTMRSTVSTPSACLRSTPIDRRPRFSTSIHPGSNPRSTDCARSTRTTSAPMSESSIAANGPGPMPAISMTFTFDSGPMRPTLATVLCMVETIASGYGLVEGPTVDENGNLYFSDVLGGGVYRRDPDGDITTVVPKRRGVGGIVLHADGGVVVSGRDIVHVRDGENRTLYSIDGVPGWNDICTDSAGRVYAGSIRFAVFDPDATPVPGELWRIDAEGDATCLYDNVLHANGVVLSPGEQTIYHSDTRNNVILVHTLADDGTAGDRRAFHFPPGAPDGMAVDAQGLLWVASARAGCVARLTPDGEIDRVLEVPAQTVTSLCFAGRDQHDLYVVTADNTEVPDRRGTIFRVTAGVGGAPVHPARI